MPSPLGLAAPVDLPEVELRVLEREGVVFRSGPSWSSVAELDGPGLRLRSLRVLLPAGVAAARRTAAWVWGARGSCPDLVEACVDIGRRPGLQLSGVRISEVVLEEGDLVRHGADAVTSVRRTTLDLLRGDAWGAPDVELVTRLVTDHALDPTALRASLVARRRLPHKRRALTRLDEVGARLTPR
ncbi:hypothetical protein [Frigoribacterium salinisoli]